MQVGGTKPAAGLICGVGGLIRRTAGPGRRAGGRRLGRWVESGVRILSHVEVRDLAKSFPTVDGQEKLAVAGISFQVLAGEIYGLLGPNGAGKTTTLRILAGLMRPTSGQVLVNGHDVCVDPFSAKKCIGFLTANAGLYQRLSPRELLPYFGLLNGMEMPLIEERVNKLIGWLDMDEFADTRCGALSTGQKQRTHIARALIADPPILILDEPTLGLDVLTNRTILDFIRQERQLGKAILLSTHYLDEAERLCDRIGLLHQGRLIAEGDMPALRALSGCPRLTDIFLKLVDHKSEIAPRAVEGAAATDAPLLAQAKPLSQTAPSQESAS